METPKRNESSTPTMPTVREIRAPVDDPGEHVPSQRVGPQEMEGTALGRGLGAQAEEVDVGLEQAPEPVGLAPDEQLDRVADRLVHGVDLAQGLRVSPAP